MDSGLYAACTALMARTDALDSIANNLANSSTGGFRAKHTTFSSVLAGYGHPLATQLNEATNHYGLLSASRLDLQPGALERTGNEMDIAYRRPGLSRRYRQPVALPTPGMVVYRSLHRGRLLLLRAIPVLGEGGPISIPRGASITISNDGTISANGAIAGKLKIVKFLGNGGSAEPGGKLLHGCLRRMSLLHPSRRLNRGCLKDPTSIRSPASSNLSTRNGRRKACVTP